MVGAKHHDIALEMSILFALFTLQLLLKCSSPSSPLLVLLDITPNFAFWYRMRRNGI